MKKTLIALALAAIVAPAWGAEVVSSNIVGYNKITLDRGYNMLAVQFSEIGGNAQNIQDVFLGNLPDMGYDEQSEEPIWNAKFQTWTGTGFSDCFWTGSTGNDIFGEEGWNNVWVVGQYGEGGVADDTLSVGEGVFLWTANTGVTVTQAGEVATNDTKTVSLSTGYNLICNPFPEAINIQNISISNLPDMGYDEQSEEPIWNAQLQTWTGTGYADYFWTGSTGNDIFGEEGWNNVWVVGKYGEGGVADVTINVGDPFFIYLSSGSNVSATFTK